MNILIRLAALLGVLGVLIGCQTILLADFSDGIVGQPPAENPSGPFSDNVFSRPPNCVRVEEALSADANSGKAIVLISNSSANCESSAVVFESEPTHYSRSPHSALWLGRFVSLAPLRVTYGFTNLEPAFELIFEDGRIRVRPRGRSSYHTFGRYELNGTHIVRISMDRREGTYSVSVSGDGGSGEIQDTYEPQVDTLDPLGRPVLLSMSYNGVGNAAYLIDTVVIAERRPEDMRP